MDIKQIKKLIDIVKQNHVAELEVKNDQEAIHIVLKPNGAVVDPASSALVNAAVVPQASSNVNQSAPSGAAPSVSAETKDEQSYKPEDLVTSPMVGTVYLSANPGKDPFVRLGDTVKAGDTLCLIEAMKMFNRIEAQKSGQITHILIDDSQSVEFGQPLFVVK